MRETDGAAPISKPPPVGAEAAHLPFGGLKESALEPKELGSAADSFTQTKTVYLDYP